jgi:hypothetical protein
VLLAKANMHNALHGGISLKEYLAFKQSNTGTSVKRKTISPRADGGKGYGPQVVFHDQAETTPVAPRQQFILAVHPIFPDWPNGMDNAPGRQLVSARHLGVARFAPVQLAAFLE